jgi:anti-anti-sigma regulatory factor
VAEEDHIEVAVIDRTVYLKPVGFGTQQNSLGIPDFLSAMFRAGCSNVAFDLGACKGMDSTFLGVIATAATASRRRPGKTVIVLNARERLVTQLRRIGLLPLVCLHKERTEPPADMQLRHIDFVHFPKTEYQKLQTVKLLHQQLVKLNEKNKQLFGPFIAMLEEELGPQQADGILQ